MSQQPDRPPTVRINPAIIIPMFGILLAPFLGLLYDANLGLFILVVCLGFMGYMTWKISTEVPPAQQRTLRFGAILNGVMAVLALLLLLVRL